MAYVYCVYKQSRSCQLPFCASPIFHFEIGDFSVYLYIENSPGCTTRWARSRSPNYLCWNETVHYGMKRNDKRCFLRIVCDVAVSFLWLLVKRNGSVLNDIGNVFLTRTVQ